MKNMKKKKKKKKKKKNIYIYRKKVARYGAFLYMKPFLWGVKKLWGVYTTPHFLSTTVDSGHPFYPP